MSFSMDKSHDSSFSKGRASASSVNLVLGSDAALVQLGGHLLEGDLLAMVEVEAYRSGADGPQLVHEYLFTHVLASTLQSDGNTTLVSLEYSEYQQSHLAFDSKGAMAETTSFGWDFAGDTLTDFGEMNLICSNSPDTRFASQLGASSSCRM